MTVQALAILPRLNQAARFAFVSAILCVSLLVTACGGGTGDTTGNSTNSLSTIPSPGSIMLTVSKTGSGSVTSSPGGINCGANCTASYAAGTAVTLTAAAASGYSFAGWSGACSGTSASCSVSMTAARSVTATFSLTLSNAAILAWDPPVTTANLAGYRLYYGTVSGSYLQAFGQGISVGNVSTYTLMGLSSGTRYYFAVTAIDNLGNESVYSNEAFKDVP